MIHASPPEVAKEGEKRKEKRKGDESRSLRGVILHDADLCSAQDAAVELKALLLNVADGIILLVGHGRHEDSLMLIRIKLATHRINLLKTMLFERLLKNSLRHLEPLVQIGEVLQILRLVGGVELRLRDGGERAVEVVNAIDEVLCEAGDCEVARCFHLAGCSVLEVAEVGYGAEAFILPFSCLEFFGFDGFPQLGEGIARGWRLVCCGFALWRGGFAACVGGGIGIGGLAGGGMFVCGLLLVGCFAIPSGVRGRGPEAEW